MILDIKNGMKGLTEDAIESLKEFVLTQQSSDGGFLDRDNKSDIYYTVFGIQLSIAFDVKLKFDILKYLNKIEKEKELDFIHLTSLLRSYELLNYTPLNRDHLLQAIEKYRTKNGGYNHLRIGMEKGNVYAPFLLSLINGQNSSSKKQKQIIDSINCCKKDDGSYGNDHEILSGSTTATSAAIALLNEFNHTSGGKCQLLDSDFSRDKQVGLFDPSLFAGRGLIEKNNLKSFQLLESRACENGGFFAGDSAPIPDLLSTATAIFAISNSPNFQLSNIDKHREFVASLWNEDGGFSGHIMDSVSDCEYTFYALLALGSIS